MMNFSLYERIGGEEAVHATVSRLYDKILSDATLAPFFENMNIEALKHSQEAFVTFAFGGPSEYRGKAMRSAHASAVLQGLSDKHFDVVVTYLKFTMIELRVPIVRIEEAIAIVEDVRCEVLNK